MEEKIIEMAKNLINVRELKAEIDNPDYWIQKAAQETDFVPAEGDWIHVEITIYKIEVDVYHKQHGGGKYWKNGVWYNDPFGFGYPMHEQMLAEMQV